MKTGRRKLKATLAITIMLTTALLYAQPGGGGGGQGGGGNPPGTGAPVDGGAAIFLAGVAGYSYLQLKKNKQNSRSNLPHNN